MSTSVINQIYIRYIHIPSLSLVVTPSSPGCGFQASHSEKQ